MIKELENFLPTYETILPFCGKKVQFVPFKVKDAKHISIILQENDKKLSLISLANVLKNCAKEINVNELCVADAEFLFLQIRSKSIEEYLTLVSNDVKVKVNVADIKTRNQLISEEIEVGPSLKIVMETPKIKDLIALESLEKQHLIKSSIKKIIVKNEIYHVDKFVPAEFKKIFDELPINVSIKADEFFKKQPELYIEVDFKGEKKEVSGILNFFTYR